MECPSSLSKIGKGGVGEVFMLNGNQACKIIEHNITLGVPYPNEFDIMNRMDSEFVMHIDDIYLPSAMNYKSLGIVTLLGKNCSTLKLEDIFKIVQGVDYLHRNGVLHLDIKPGNIILTEFNKPKIIDFGSSKVVRSVKEGYYTTLPIGTGSYRPPEHFEGYSTNQKMRCVYKDSSDVWSLGMTILSLITGSHLLPNKIREFGVSTDLIFYFLKTNISSPSSRDEIIRGKIRKCISIPPEKHEGIIDLLSKMLEWNPAKRVGMCQIITHSIFKDFKEDEIFNPSFIPTWPLEEFQPGDDTMCVKECIIYTLKILKHPFFSNFGIGILFHAVDIVYRFAITDKGCEVINTIQGRIEVAAVAVNIAIKYHGPPTVDVYTIIKGILPQWVWKENLTRQLLHLEEDIYEQFSLMVYRRFMYDSIKTRRDVIKFYRKYILDPSEYYQFTPNPVDPLTFIDMTDPSFVYKTIQDFSFTTPS